MLVEKDYWIMHGLWGLQAQGFVFELKGGTSLSKGFGVIHRFSEDIDIRIEPPDDLDVKTGRNQDKPAHIASRLAFYDELAKRIRIPGIVSVERDTFFDDDKMRSAGIRLNYSPRTTSLSGVKDGILLELGFDDTAPNRAVTISSWLWSLPGIEVFRSWTTALWMSLVMRPRTPSLKNSKPSRPSTGGWPRPRPSPPIFFGTITMCTAFLSFRWCKRSCRLPHTRNARFSASGPVMSWSLPKILHSP